MEVKVLEQDERRLKVRVDDISHEMANAIRRAVVGEVPVMAIDSIDVEENNSGLVDEMLAHRLAMIPLTFPDTYNVRAVCKSCKGRGCSNCTVELSLEAKGPKSVSAADFVSDDKNVQPLDPATPLVELLEAQEIKLTALAQLGYGKDHAKWQAAVCGYDQKGKGFVFSVESACGLSAAEVFKRALEELAGRAGEFAKAVKKEL